MNVLMIAPQPFFEPRGTPISVYQRLQGLSALGHQIDLVAYHVGQDVEIDGVRIYRTPRFPFIKQVSIGPSFAKLFLDGFLFLLACWMLLRRRYDVIHSHEEAAFMGVALAFIFRTRHLYDMHSSLPKQLVNFRSFTYRPVIRVFEFLENIVIRTCDVVLTIGFDLEEHVVKINPTANYIRIENTALHHSFRVDKTAAGQIRAQLHLENQPVIVYTGTLERYQGLDLLLDSLQIVRKETGDASLVIVGGKPSQVAYWENEARERNLSDCVRFVGTVSLEESLHYLELADILVSPRSQGLSVPLKIYTYLYAGKPIVATRIPAHTLVLDDANAVLVEPEAHAYAQALASLIANPDLRAKMGEAARAYAEAEFSREKYLEKLDLAYRSLSLSKPIRQIQLIEG